MKSYFFDGVLTGYDAEGDPVYDRMYKMSDHAEYYGAIFTPGVFLMTDTGACYVTKTGSGSDTALNIAPGWCEINGYRGKCEGDDYIPAAGLPDGRYRVMLRLDISVPVRAINPVLVYGGEHEYPELQRNGTMSDLCLSNVTVSGGVIYLDDTRYDKELCGCVSFAGLPPRPPYYPPGDLPLDLWLYTIFPDELTPEQKQLVEENEQLMAIFKASRLGDGPGPKPDEILEWAWLGASHLGIAGLA